jgi:hypothetical protein
VFLVVRAEARTYLRGKSKCNGKGEKQIPFGDDKQKSKDEKQIPPLRYGMTNKKATVNAGVSPLRFAPVEMTVLIGWA